MTPTYREYQNQIEELQRKAAAARKEEVGSTIRDIKKKIAEFGLTAADLGLAAPAAPRRAARQAEKAADPKAGRKKRRSTAGKKVAPKYRSPAGDLWTGRGRQPAWVVAELAAGRTLEDLLIK
ncbi:MAG TPA: H-NS histone family protein [Burkholderiaceae bacterium]|jgi:DNA-binding protein H-NS|nr:H-NS histone family protein [Burkholderiaceae bacterium]